MIKASEPVAKPTVSKVSTAENKAGGKVLPSFQPIQLEAETEMQNSVLSLTESSHGKMAPSSPLQFKSASSIIPTNHSPIQRKSSDTWAFQSKLVGDNSNSTATVQRAAAPVNKTGLPDNVKSGVEQLSGISLGDVKVHYNSPKPAQLQAHAYAQGTDIHVASGQEKHVPHEAWHVVQQKQGRVQATKQMKGKVPVNDDVGLEKEADVMGAKALQMVSFENQKAQNKLSNLNVTSNGAPVQGMFEWLFGVSKSPEDAKKLEESIESDWKVVGEDDGMQSTEVVDDSEFENIETRERSGAKDSEKAKLQKEFVNRVTKAVGTIDWEGIKVLSTYREKMGDAASIVGTVADAGRKAEDNLKTPLTVLKGSNLVTLGEKERNGTLGKPEDAVSISVPDPTLSDLGNKEEKQIMSGEQKAEVNNLLTAPLMTIMDSISTLTQAKDLIEGKVKMDKLSSVKLLKTAASASLNGLKAAHVIITFAGGPTISYFSSLVPGLGLAISSANIAIGLFQRWNAQGALEDMQTLQNKFEYPDLLDNSNLFYTESRGALLSWETYHRVVPKVLAELEVAAKQKDGNQTVIDKYKRLGIEIPGGDIQAFVDKLNAWNLQSKMYEINHKRIRHGAVAMASDIMILAGNMAVLVPGGQVAAGILHGAAGTAKLVVAASVSMNKMLKGQNGTDASDEEKEKRAQGTFSALSMGGLNEESTVKHAEYVQHTKTIFGMYSKINPENESFESEIEKVEKIVNAAGVYPPAVYKEIDSNDAAGAYRSVHKLVGAMKSGR